MRIEGARNDGCPMARQIGAIVDSDVSQRPSPHLRINHHFYIINVPFIRSCEDGPSSALFDFARSSPTSSPSSTCVLSVMPLVSNNYGSTIESFHQSLFNLLSRICLDRSVAARVPLAIIADAVRRTSCYLQLVADNDKTRVLPESITRSFF